MFRIKWNWWISIAVLCVYDHIFSPSDHQSSVLSSNTDKLMNRSCLNYRSKLNTHTVVMKWSSSFFLIIIIFWLFWYRNLLSWWWNAEEGLWNDKNKLIQIWSMIHLPNDGICEWWVQTVNTIVDRGYNDHVPVRFWNMIIHHIFS